MDIGLLLLRLVVGLAARGTQKLFAWFGGPGLDGVGQFFAYRRTLKNAHAYAPGQFHSTIIRSAHSTSETKIAGLPNFAPH
jgi:hypothetical protein